MSIISQVEIIDLKPNSPVTPDVNINAENI